MCSLKLYSGGLPTYPPNAALDAVLILISELHRAGTIDDKVMAGIMCKLELSEHHDVADRVAALPLQNLLFDPND